MPGLIKQMEDKYIAKEKEDLLAKHRVPLAHTTEIVMRVAYAEGAKVFREVGRFEGDQSRKKKIIEALGLVEEEPAA